MEYYWNMFNNSSTSSSSTGTSNNSNSLRGHNSNFPTTPNHAWQYSDLSSSRVDWTNYPISTAGGGFHALTQEEKGPHYCKPDPHLMCLNLGKRHYFENVNGGAPVRHVAAAMTKKGKLQYRESPSAAVAPRCQVEGCVAVLVKAKEYHKRHKVCEMHAKAPRVVVDGIEQRFCQQCSRFHVVGEFDEAKRSCRRRLAGHNERRRKTSQNPNSLSRKPYQDIKMMSNAGPHFLHSECAHSLLSSTNISNIPPSSDLPARCTAALHELIAENRASFLAYRQQFNSGQIEGPDFNNYPNASIRAGSSDPRFFNLHENGEHVTLNLMQDPNSAFGLLSVHDHNKTSKGEQEDSCSELWKFPLGY